MKKSIKVLDLNIFGLFKLNILVLFMFSMYPWFVWNISLFPFYFLSACFISVFFVFYRSYFDVNVKNLTAVLLIFFCFLFYIKGFTVFGIIEQSLVFTIISITLMLKDVNKIKALDFITKYLSIFLLISLILYIIHLIGIPLPHLVISESKLQYTGVNYFLFVTNLEDSYNYYRFRSIYAEPGHLTMGLVPLLYANRFNIKNRYVLVIFIVQLLTLSLAGYIAVFFAFLLYSFSPYPNKIYSRVVIFSVLIFSFFFVNAISEESLISQTIVSRLVYDESKGTIAGYNRTSIDVDNYFENYIGTSSSYLGIGNDMTELMFPDAGAGYKIFILRFGLIATILIILFYFLIAVRYGYRLFGFFIIVMLLLYQNSYPFWFAVIFAFQFGLPKLSTFYRSQLKKAIAK